VAVVGLAGTIPVEWVVFFVFSSVICTGARSAVMVVGKAAVDG
jgi:hypothetical protein